MANQNAKELKKLFAALAKIQLDEVEEGLKNMKLSVPSGFEFIRQLVQATSTVVMDRNIADADAYINHLNHSLPYITPSLTKLSVKEVRARCRGSKRSVDFWRWLDGRLAQCAKLLKLWEEVKTIIQLAKKIYKLHQLEEVPVSLNDEIQKARDLMKNTEISYEKMSTLLDILKVFNGLSPKPIRKYIEVTMSAFQNIRKIMNTCKAHSEKILKLLEEIDRLEEKAKGNPNTWWRQNETELPKLLPKSK